MTRPQETSASHTPGPWSVNTAHEDPQFQSVSDKDGRTIADIAYHKFTETHYPLRAESEANARLIAAAPELLDAAKWALNFITNTERSYGIELDASAKLRSAIDNAEGRS